MKRPSVATASQRGYGVAPNCPDAMCGVAIEDLLELWSAELRRAKTRVSWLIGHPRVAASAFPDTPLGSEYRRTGERPARSTVQWSSLQESHRAA